MIETTPTRTLRMALDLAENMDSIDLSSFPSEYHRIVRAWYLWQRRTLVRSGHGLGRTTIPRATPEYSYWLANIPKMSGEELVLDIGSIFWYSVPQINGFALQSRERNDRKYVGWIRDFGDVEKYLYSTIGDLPFFSHYKQAPQHNWYQSGVASGVRLESTGDDGNSPSSLSIAGENERRASMGRMDAVWFSHPLTMNYEQVAARYEDAFARMGS